MLHTTRQVIESWTPREVAEAVAKADFGDFREFCEHLKRILNERPFIRDVKAIDLKELGDNLFERTKEWNTKGDRSDPTT